MIPKGPELLIILAIILLLFGARKLPELGRSVGQSLRELRSGFQEEDDASPSSDDSNL